MQIDSKMAAYLEDLSFLALSEEEKSAFMDYMQNILKNISRISELNTDNVAECSQPNEMVNVFREDIVQQFFSRDEILSNAPLKNDEYFIAPRTVE